MSENEKTALENLEYIKKKILGFLNRNIDDCICIGGQLTDLKTFECYKYEINPKTKKAYKNLYDYTKNVFKIGKTSCKNYIAVCEKFGVNKTAVKPAFKEFNHTQLVEMLSLSEDELKEVSPNMTAQEIRALKKHGQLTGQKTVRAEKITKLKPKETAYLIHFETELFEKVCAHLKQFKGEVTIHGFVNSLVRKNFEEKKEN